MIFNRSHTSGKKITQTIDCLFLFNILYSPRLSTKSCTLTLLFESSEKNIIFVGRNSIWIFPVLKYCLKHHFGSRLQSFTKISINLPMFGKGSLTLAWQNKTYNTYSTTDIIATIILHSGYLIVTFVRKEKGPLHIYGHIRARAGTTATSNESIMTLKPGGMLMPTQYTILRNIGVLFGWFVLKIFCLRRGFYSPFALGS